MTSHPEQGKIRIRGERLVLRDFVLSDEDAVHAFAGDPVVTRFTDWGPTRWKMPREVVSQCVAQARSADRVEFNLAAVLASSGELIGSTAIWITSREHRRGELGYVFDRDFWNHGYATEAAKSLLRFGFGDLGLKRVSATCHPDDVGSARVLEKAGMRFEGRLRSHLLVQGVWRDSPLYAAVNETMGSHGLATPHTF